MNNQKPTKPTPQRMCAICRTKDAKRALTRLVKLADGGVEIDPTGKRNGRGAYVCDNPVCWEKALTTGALEKALRTTLDSEARARLRLAVPTS